MSCCVYSQMFGGNVIRLSRCLHVSLSCKSSISVSCEYPSTSGVSGVHEVEVNELFSSQTVNGENGMKLRIRINAHRHTVALEAADPTMTQLRDQIRETLLAQHRLSPDTEFSVSLNGSEFLSDTGQTLSSCGIVSGDLITVVLPESLAAAAAAAPAAATTAAAAAPQPSISATTASEAGSSSSAALLEAEVPDDPGPLTPDEGAGPWCWEPMLCSEVQEGQAPLSLELLYHTAHVICPSDAIMVVANLLMLETGYVPQALEPKPGEMPEGWRSMGGVYRLKYTHPLCDNSLAMVVGVVMGPVLVINATLKVNDCVETIRKLCLSPGGYVTDDWPGESAAAAFKCLSKLSRVFKDQLAYPMIAAARDAMALPVAFGLAALPPELLLKVVRLLDLQSVVRLSGVCRHFNTVTSDPMLWRHLCHRDFSGQVWDRDRDTDWKKVYKNAHKVRKQRRSMCRPAPWTTGPIILPRPPPPLSPLSRIIIGEDDRMPNLLPFPRPLPLPSPPHRSDDTHPGGVGLRRGRPMGTGSGMLARRGFI